MSQLELNLSMWLKVKYDGMGGLPTCNFNFANIMSYIETLLGSHMH